MKYPPESDLLDFSRPERLAPQIEHRFLKALARAVTEELYPGNYRDYLEHFYHSGYHKIIERRAQQLAEELRLLYQKNTGDSADPLIYTTLHREFAGLIDQFVLLHCRSLHHMDLPQAILRYANRERSEVDLAQMIFDYLDFRREPEKVYTQIDQISPDALQRAVRSFLLMGKAERLLFICDQSLFGSAREGFAMTDRGLYWKAHLHLPQTVLYQDLQSIRRPNGDWIEINEEFFNVSPSLNWKLFKLLRKLRDWEGPPTTKEGTAPT